ncbi:13453_t:CDS:2 [Ambispora leptoticha]|uniref:13453_t:CDS:1 n=1 Tax=Ambispora leptoticha TaxID=144679 RepID=A0A9N8YXD5_9GLOM|nr:13453_t:CDS:2 [Ambispora leptoticha]
MKFSHTLQFNSVPDWAEHYIAYSNLKKLIYQIERDIISTSIDARGDTETAQPTEETFLLDSKTRANTIFIPALDKELEKITTFYVSKEKEVFEETEKLLADVAYVESFETLPINIPSRRNFSRSFDSSDSLNQILKKPTRQRYSSGSAGSFLSSDDDEHQLNSPVNDETNLLEISYHHNPQLTEDEQRIYHFWSNPLIEAERIRLKKRTTEVYVWLSELKSFVSLNHTGFSKILKKYDKITNSTQIKSSYMTNMVGEGYPFKKSSRQILDEHIRHMEEIYAKLCTFNDIKAAAKELKTHLREFIVWERNTIWRDIIGLERKSHGVGIKAHPTVEELEISKIETPFGEVNVSAEYWKTAFILTACTGVFAILLEARIFKAVEVRNCFALLVFSSLLWATEVIPLFVTSLLIPFLVVCLRVMRSNDELHVRLDAHDATRDIFAAMFSPVIMLLLGGFAIAAALSKYHIAKMMATYVLSKAGKKPSWVLLANMIVATVASMWISNVAAPVLCLSLIQPILRNLQSNSSFGRCLILGIALASNIGGMASPISSPQNIIAIKNMMPQPSWIEWFIISIPLCILADIVIWIILLWNYKPAETSLLIHPIRASRDPWSNTQIFVCVVTLITIVLWCAEKQLEFYLGDMGVIAILPLVLFFGTGILTKEDFNNFLWTVIILAMGGIALGKAVQSSGLLAIIAHQIRDMVQGFTVWEVLLTFCTLVLVVATFISHTVGALIILPIVAQVGDSLGDDNTSYRNLLVMASALMCSAAMGLPVSGFPNMNAIMMEDEMGVRYLTTKDFLKTGVPASILTMLLVVSVGYVLMHLFLGY